jgi:hypothetical protein
MILDRKNKPWAIATLAAFLVALVLFIAYATTHRARMSGGSWPGLAFGFTGSAAMLVAMLLALRKRFRAVRMGKAYYWMQAHVWIGLLSYPLIVFHAGGFSWGGSLTQVLMWLFTIVFISGIVGLLIQQTLPTKLLREVPAETIYDQVQTVIAELREEAQDLVVPLLEQQEERALEAELTSGPAALATIARAGVAGESLQKFYRELVVPFLAEPFDNRLTLASDLASQEAFHVLRTRLPADLYLSVAKLQTLVDERRQLHRQQRLHWWLHGWLLLHVPLSYAVVVLGIIHAIMAFRFTSP